MSHPARLSLRAPPHLPFIQGFPGIPPGADRKPAGVSGTVEVRVGAQAVKAKWVRVEIRRHEQLPPGFPSQEETWEHVGEINNLWTSPAGKEFDSLETADFKFFLPLPETTAPSVEMMKGSGVRYELVAALCYKKKGGIFKSDSTGIIKISEPLRVTKHELHSAWPVYNNPDAKTVAEQDVSMTVQRPGVAFGPGDRLLLTASVRSGRQIPFKLRGFECTLLEVVTMYAPQSGAKDKKKKVHGPVVKSRPIAQARCAVDESVGRGGEKSARIDMAVPSDNLLVTVRNAKTLEVGYELKVKAVCDGFEGPTVAAVRYVVGLYSRSSAQQAVKDIGHVESLCPFTSPPQSRPTSSLGSPPPTSQQSSRPQSFAGAPPAAPADWRRQSPSSTTTTTTVNADRVNDWLPLPNNRPYSTVPARQPLAFPTASPAPAPMLQRSASTTISDYSTQSPVDGPSDGSTTPNYNRFSAATTATFGNWDRSLQSNMRGIRESTSSPSSPITPASSRFSVPAPITAHTPVRTMTPGASHAPPPSVWPAESEKVNLYNDARQTAASSQRTTGVSMGKIGMDDIPDTAPPEYAPPVPPVPAVIQEARSRPQSMLLSSPPLSGPSSGPTPILSPAITPTQPTAPVAALAPALPPKPAAGTVSAMDEKEQQRRYWEARDKVGRGTAGQGSGVPTGVAAASLAPAAAPSASGSSTVDAVPGSFPSAEQEKDVMRKRYEEATSRVAGASGSGSSAPAAAATAAGGMAMANGSSSGNVSAATSTMPSPAAPSPAGYMSAADEKEQMRKRFEQASLAVSRAQGSGPRMDEPPPFTANSSESAGPAQAAQAQAHPQTQATSPAREASGAGGSGSVPRPTSAFPSAEQEKDAMRRRFDEAQGRVQRAAGRESMSPPPPAFSGSDFAVATNGSVPLVSTPDAIGSPVGVSADPQSGGSGSGSGFSSRSPAGAGAGAGSNSSAGWMSAEQEKEAMRLRFEAATQRVQRAHARQSMGMPPSGSWAAESAGVGMGAGLDASGHSSGGPSAGVGSTANGLNSGRALEGPGKGPADASGLGGERTDGRGGASASASAPVTEAPPPPLPARPPADYINLLSPTGPAQGKRFSFA